MGTLELTMILASHGFQFKLQVLEQRCLLMHGTAIPYLVIAYKDYIYHSHCSGRRGVDSAHIPNVRMSSNNRARKINPHLLPTSSAAVQLYEERGGRLREVSEFGRDPIANNTDKYRIRMQAFTEKYPSFEYIFSSLVNGNTVPLNALKFYISITYRLSMN